MPARIAHGMGRLERLRARATATREARRAAGVCLQCGRGPLITKTYCETCRTRLSTWQKQKVRSRKAAGTCLWCDAPAAMGRTLCHPHARVNASKISDKVSGYRTAVLTALGARCSCMSRQCWHNGPCAIADKRILTVDHINGDGAAHRGRHVRDGYRRWKLYHAAVISGSHDLALLCPNCHFLKDTPRLV